MGVYSWPDPPSRIAHDAQFDFSGGENSVGDKALLKENEVAQLQNLLQKRGGGGCTARGGHKLLVAAAAAGRMIQEFDQSSGQIITYQQSGAVFYDETMMPRYVLFNATVAINDAANFGARARFNQLILYAVFSYANPGAGATFVFEVSDGAGGWIDKTASITASVANSKQMRGVPGEWTFSWPVFSDWLPDQVNGGAYLYWIRIRCTLGGAEANALVQGQRRVRSDWLGQRKLAIATTNQLYECPLFSGVRLVESWSATNRFARTGGAALNDYFYMHSDGQRNLRRWNGARGSTRSTFNNAPTDAGLIAPVAPTLNAATGGLGAGYNNGATIRYRASYLYGPEGILGESPPSPSVEQVFTGAGQWRANVNLLNMINNAGATDVYGIKVYATNDVTAADASERDQMWRYLLIATIVRDDATWVATVLQDAKLPRAVSGQASPISYVNTPPFYPKGVTTGGDRLWIWNDHFVACSDIRAGDSWDPDFVFKYQQVVAAFWWDEVMLVFAPNRIYAINGINSGAPYQTVFFDGFGCVQPESITVGDGYLYFMSRLGPARLSKLGGVELLALGRTFESTNYWGGTAAERRMAMGAYFNHRYWIPIDNGSDKDGCNANVAVYDMFGRGWSYLTYQTAAFVQLPIGTLAVVHAPLDHPLANQLVLVGFPDTATGSENRSFSLFEYGTTDRWTTFPYDGAAITTQFTSRGLPMGALERTKEYRKGHVRVRFPFQSVLRTVLVELLPDVGGAPSQQVTVGGSNAGVSYVDIRWEHTVAAKPAGGFFMENCPQLYISASSDLGFDIVGWWLEAEIEEFETGWTV